MLDNAGERREASRSSAYEAELDLDFRSSRARDVPGDSLGLGLELVFIVGCAQQLLGESVARSGMLPLSAGERA